MITGLLLAAVVFQPAISRDSKGSDSVCATLVTRARSLRQTTPSSTGIVTTTDGSILLSVQSTGNIRESAWSADERMLGIRHSFAGSGDDEERIDVSKPFTQVMVSVGGVSCPVAFVNIPQATPGPRKVAMFERGRSTPAIALGSLDLSPQVRLDDVVMAYDGTEVRLTGHLTLDKELHSIEVVSLRLDSGGLHLRPPYPYVTAPRDEPFTQAIPLKLMEFDLPFANDAALPAPQPKAVVQLLLAKGVSIGGDRSNGLSVALRRRADGVFEKTWPAGAAMTWPGQQRCDQGVIRSITIDPTVDQRAAQAVSPKSHLLVDGNIAFGGNTMPCRSNDPTINLTSFGEFVVGSQRHESVAFTMPASTVVSGLDHLRYTKLAGWFDDARNAHLTISGTLEIGLPPSVRSALARQNLFAKTIDPGDVRDAIIPFDNVKAVVPAENLQHPDQWQLSFADAMVRESAEEKALFFGHDIKPCLVSPTDSTVPVLKHRQLCLGVRLERGDQDPKNLINVTLDLCGSRVQDDEKDPTPACRDKSQPLGIARFKANLPQHVSAELRVGVARLNFSGIEFSTANALASGTSAADAAEDPPELNAFGDVVSEEQLLRLGCKGFDATGFATLESFEVPGVASNLAFGASQAQAASGVIAASVGQPPQSVSSGNSEHPSIPTIPRVGFGRDCSLFALTGWFPIQISPQSSVVVTSLVFVHGKGKRSDPVFLNAAGLITTGNITVVFKSLGFRTLNDADIAEKDAKAPNVAMLCSISETTAPINCVDAKGSSTADAAHVKEMHRVDACEKGEGRVGRYCLRVEVDTGLTLAITGARNSDAIGKAVAGGFSFLAGILIGHH